MALYFVDDFVNETFADVLEFQSMKTYSYWPLCLAACTADSFCAAASFDTNTLTCYFSVEPKVLVYSEPSDIDRLCFAKKEYFSQLMVSNLSTKLARGQLEALVVCIFHIHMVFSAQC